LKEKEKVELKVKVTGSPVPDVKWYKDDKEIMATFKVKMSQKDDVYTLSMGGATVKSTPGLYKAVAINKAGKAEHAANITVGGRSLCVGRNIPQHALVHSQGY
jgi:hypothetical protein